MPKIPSPDTWLRAKMLALRSRRAEGQVNKEQVSEANDADSLLPPPPPYQELNKYEERWDHYTRCICRNFRKCWLLHLPDKILVNIMNSAELHDLLRLRHTSRAFMRLFTTESCFRRYHLTEADYEMLHDTNRIWAVPRSWYPSQTEAFFGDPSMCIPCRKKRNGDILGKELLSAMPLLYCSRCRSSHRTMHFSALQRQEADDNERICFGHEGSVQVCNHIVLNLHQVKSRANNPAGGLDQLECHLPHTNNLHQCGVESCPGDARPRAHCYKDKSGNIHLKMSFSTHIQVKRREGGKFCSWSLRESIQQWRKTDGLGGWLPSYLMVLGAPLRVFDPNICDCLDWFNTPPGVTAYHMQFEKTLSSSIYTRHSRERAPLKGYQTQSGRCSQLRHGFTSRTAGSEIQIDFLKCLGNNDLLVLRKVVDCKVDPTFASTSGWGDYVDVGVHRDQDKEMHGVLGCPTPYCQVDKLPDYGLDLRAEECKKMLVEWPRI